MTPFSHISDEQLRAEIRQIKSVLAAYAATRDYGQRRAEQEGRTAAERDLAVFQSEAERRGLNG